ncbi:MAG TPA: zf-HC2 domain-containing protein [Candidatus Dormibacteraeota bacterium]|nr:zf-HC2 domain-containing protein [Candidatus Dormibacteraeota bacterium]
MKCSLLTLSCALDGELSRDRQLELDAHLITCERCKTGMRYLREETERISLLAPIRLSNDKTTALLERSRVLVSTTGQTQAGTAEHSEDELPRPVVAAPDPFGALGISAAILDVPSLPEPEGATPSDQEGDETAVEPAAEAPDEVTPELEHGSAFEAEEADGTTSDALAAVPEELWLADDTDDLSTEGTAETNAPTDELGAPPFAEHDAIAADDSPTLADPPPSAAGAEAASVAAEEGAFDLDSAPTNSDSPRAQDDVAPENYRPSTMVVPGWEPATELKMPWGDIPAATPTKDTWAPEVTGLAGVPGLPVSRQTPLPPAAPFPAAPPPTRPATAAVPGLQADRKSSTLDREPPRRSAGGGSRRPIASKSGSGGPEARSWTRTGLIAVAALAAVLIVWNITHGSTPAGTPHLQGKSTPTATAKPSPSVSATTTPTPAPTALALTGTQTVGSSGSGYSVQSVQYGVHGSQFWVVFHFSGGSGEPSITSGFDGSQTIYLEMQGVAPGTAVLQPAAGSLVSSISIGHVAGFSGAVYVLHLSRAAQISPSELTGSEAGAPGYLAIIQ